MIYSDRDLGDAYDKKFHGSIKNLVITDVYKIKELYEDIVYYTELLNFGQKSWFTYSEIYWSRININE